MQELELVFGSYVQSARHKLQEAAKPSMIRGPLQLLPNRATLIAKVEDLERTSQFQRLLEETRSGFSKGEERAIKSFFRRSGCYLDAFEGKTINIDTLFDAYCKAFQRDEVQVTYLAPMEFVSFAQDSMDFGDFQICRFTKDNLSSILGSRVNEVFYPWAVVDVNGLHDYWFIQITRGQSSLESCAIELPEDWDSIDRVKPRFTTHPSDLHFIIKQLALFDWQADCWRNPILQRGGRRSPDDQKRGWLGFGIPFVLRIHDNLLASPNHPPEIPHLETEPVIDSRTGEELREEPAFHIKLENGETASFKAFVEEVGNLLSNLQASSHPWKSLDLALQFFMKGFFAEGMEQILWHITSLEALLGQEGAGLKKRLAGRISSILGADGPEREDICKRFEELYRFRSDLVHGNQFKEEVYAGHLRDARDFARKTLLWFLNCFSAIQAAIPEENSSSFPNCEDVLLLLDIKQETRIRLTKLVGRLPEHFPQVPEWLQ